MREAAHRAIDRYGVGAAPRPWSAATSRCTARRSGASRRSADAARPALGSGYAANLGISPRSPTANRDLLRRAQSRVPHRWRAPVASAGHALSMVTRYARRHHGPLRPPCCIVATDAVFSMDGDIASSRLPRLCERHRRMAGARRRAASASPARSDATLFRRALRASLWRHSARPSGVMGAFVAGEEEPMGGSCNARTYICSTARCR